ncbi:DUF2207 domain-containing protein [Microbacterium candidum]|uniref:DUF2207 domain-containing protein n=1 Tax=Microbacterium candidum TaxID=3041922 RepID=A0ABT7MWS2_9MICO|nr:DUF2207 domain-containing protein [Microbacterium sp. ASV49]MDL9978886.1 DUF2207 domain-containing protein [Microbacterium sp. ASV49]
MHRLRRLVAIAGVAASLLLLSVPAAAQAAPVAMRTSAAAPGIVTAGVDDFTFASMDVQYTLGRAADGTSTLTVVETFVADFPQTDQNHGMRRIVPESYNGQPTFPTLVSITDGSGNPRESETDSSDGWYTMTSRSDQFVHGPQTYVFTYTMRNVTWFFADTGDDEFYWNVNGLVWPQPFGRVSATVHMDAALAAALNGQQSCYHGAQGSTQQCDIVVDKTSNGATASAAISDVPPYQTMTIAIGFAKGTFVPFDSSPLASGWGWGQLVAGLGALAALVIAIVARSRRLRDDPGRPTIIAECGPPAGFDAALSAALLQLSTKVVPAEILEQAVAGSIRIVEAEHGLFGKVRLQAELVDAARADEDGRMLLDAMFRDGDTYVFGKQDSRFASAAKAVASWAADQLTARGFRKAVPRRVRAVPMLLALAATVLVFLLGFIAIGAGVAPLVPILSMIVAVLATVVTGVLIARKPLTGAGAEARDHLRGLKVFIEWAEADRIRMLQSPRGAERVPVDVNDPRQMLELYEKLLPYAVLFGQERQWAKQLAVLYTTTGATGPYWYVGTHGFDASSFSSQLGALSAAAASSSSTSGGSSGGGSAGGGGGGGGGGGV